MADRRAQPDVSDFYMTLDEIKQLIEFIKSHELSEFELEREGFKIRIKKAVAANASVPFAVPMVHQVAPPQVRCDAPRCHGTADGRRRPSDGSGRRAGPVRPGGPSRAGRR